VVERRRPRPRRRHDDRRRTWQRSFAPFSRCAGGTAANHGDYTRSSDPGSTSPQRRCLAGEPVGQPGDTTTGVLVSRSKDGGVTWSDPATLQRDTGNAFNDKESLTADPTDRSGRRVYVTWDRLEGPGVPGGAVPGVPLLPARGPAYFARTLDGGATWEPGRAIYDPGRANRRSATRSWCCPTGRCSTGSPSAPAASSASGKAPKAAARWRRRPGEAAGDAGGSLPGPATTNTAAPSATRRPTRGGPADRVLHRVVRSTDHGATWSPPVVWATIRPGENSARCGPGQILPSLAVDPASGAVAVVWSDGASTPPATPAVALSTSHDGV